MKITKSQLKRIIKEEIINISRIQLNEAHEDCDTDTGHEEFLADVVDTVLQLWNDKYANMCRGTSLQDLTQDLLFFIKAVEKGQAKIPKRQRVIYR